MIATDYIFGKKKSIGRDLSYTWHLKCEEEDGIIAYDAAGTNHGNHNDISLITAPGKIGRSFNFTNRNSVSVPHTEDFWLYKNGSYAPMTIMTWMKFDQIQSLQYLLNKWNTSSTRDWTYDFYQGNLRFRLWGDYGGGATSGQIHEYNTSWSPILNTWYFLAVTVDIDKRFVKHYINGSLVETIGISTYANYTYPSTAPLGIGGRAWQTGADFKGNIDEPRIVMGLTYKAEELLSVYNSEK